MFILGISAFYHDSAAAIISNGEIIAAAQEERFTRKKHDNSFPVKAIKFCLQEAGLRLCDLEAIVFYEKPILKFERILETQIEAFPKGLRLFSKSMLSWLQEKLFIKSTIHKRLNEIEVINKNDYKLRFSSHHLSHAASSYYTSGFSESLIVNIDGVGEWASTTIYKGVDSKITPIEEMHYPNSIGLLYSAFTFFCGFKVNSGEYKLMGLAPYGDKESEEYQTCYNKIRDEIVEINQDGSFNLNQKYFNYSYSLTTICEKEWEKLFGLKVNEKSEINQSYCQLALAFQTVTEELVIGVIKRAYSKYKSPNLCLAGGVALNCVANNKIEKLELFENIWIHPAAGDAGGALGCALAYDSFVRKPFENYPRLKHAYLGPSFSDKQIKAALTKAKIDYQIFETDDLLSYVSKELFQGKIVGWFQGKMEWGPRALGNRSILADPSAIDMQKNLNLKIKKREDFRPFAPIVIEDEAQNYFEATKAKPYMLFTTRLKQEHRKDLARNYKNLDPMLKLASERSEFQAITHVDFSSRLQTVNNKTNPLIYSLLEEFKKKSGFPMLVNTSFNVRGEPIVCNPTDAIKCFLNSGIDLLVMSNFVVDKSRLVDIDLSSYEVEFPKD